MCSTQRRICAILRLCTCVAASLGGMPPSKHSTKSITAICFGVLLGGTWQSWSIIALIVRTSLSRLILPLRIGRQQGRQRLIINALAPSLRTILCGGLGSFSILKPFTKQLLPIVFLQSRPYRPWLSPRFLNNIPHRPTLEK